MGNLTDIQQAFVREYMTDDRVVGVRVRRENSSWVLDVRVDKVRADSLDLPASYRGLPVRVRDGQRAVLAYATA